MAAVGGKQNSSSHTRPWHDIGEHVVVDGQHRRLLQIFDSDSKVDVMSDMASRRTNAGLDLRAILCVQSLVQDKFVLPVWIVDAIRT